MSIRTMQAATPAAAVRAGLEPAKVSPHTVRHSFATALVEQVRSLHEIGTILGHKNPATTTLYWRVKAQPLMLAMDRSCQEMGFRQPLSGAPRWQLNRAIAPLDEVETELIKNHDIGGLNKLEARIWLDGALSHEVL
ncbi:tyrosine-type recombinase/integrase [Deinococcus marmoris]|uniref:tyrosine-type recombinase/integrase n=1 Tax=Deinococcus marmoris TaxID=249408 RepID=UPI00111537C7|nr:tyrosine-type recombinase/integrase [Deinococcus marmoris]